MYMKSPGPNITSIGVALANSGIFLNPVIPRPHARCCLARCGTSSWYPFSRYCRRRLYRRYLSRSKTESFPNCLLIYTDIWNRSPSIIERELVPENLTEYIVVGVKMARSDSIRCAEPDVTSLEMAGIAPHRNLKVQCQLRYLFKKLVLR